MKLLKIFKYFRRFSFIFTFKNDKRRADFRFKTRKNRNKSMYRAIIVNVE